MAQFIFNATSKELVIAAGQKIVILDSSSQEIKQTIEIAKNLSELFSSVKDPTIENDEVDQNNKQNNEDDKLKKLQHVEASIQNVALAPNGKFIAISTAGIKTLILYSQNDMHWEMLSVRRSSRASSAIAFSSNSEIIVLCDKSGDCFSYDCKNHLQPCKWILGHLSSIYDVKFSQNGKYILTADRDEKVRITNFPNSYEIESYCLGHKEYICSIEILDHHPELLVSLSGDKTFRVWKWREGIELMQHELPASGIKMAIKSTSKTTYELSFLVFQPNSSLYTYTLDVSEKGKINIENETKFYLRSSIATSIAYVGDILLASIFDNNKLQIEAFSTNSNLDLNNFRNFKLNIEKVFASQILQEPEDISSWFKKKFDNVSDYLQRKRQRIEEKNNKRKHAH